MFWLDPVKQRAILDSKLAHRKLFDLVNLPNPLPAPEVPKIYHEEFYPSFLLGEELKDKQNEKNNNEY